MAEKRSERSLISKINYFYSVKQVKKKRVIERNFICEFENFEWNFSGGIERSARS